MHGKLVHHLVKFVLALLVTLLALIAKPANAEDTLDIERRLAEDPTNISLVVAAGSAHLEAARRGDGAALIKAAEYLDHALSLAPDDPEVLALHGSMLVLKGRDAAMPAMKMQHVLDGVGEMDRAVELAPMDFAIRYRRGMYCLNLPDFFDRAATAVEDFEHLLKMATMAPDKVSSEETTGIRLNLALAKLKVGDVEEARALLETVRTDAPGTAYAESANALLDEIDD